MNQLPYLNIHSHRREFIENSVTVGVLSADDLKIGRTYPDYSCAGIHPWWLEEFSHAEIEAFKDSIKSLVVKKSLWAIGETGIDRTMPEWLDRQKELFTWHMELAEEEKIPLIIHNVRAGADFLEIIKSRKPTSAWIFHDFRGSEELLRDLLRLHPRCFFSFGISIDNSPQIRELLPKVPVEHLFLETDDQKHLDIHDIYLRAAHHLQMDVNFLKSQIWLNFQKLVSKNL